MSQHQPRTFQWQRAGRIFTPDGRYDWMQSHAQNPAVLVMEDRLRVYFNCRPKKASDGSVRARPTFVDLDRGDPRTILAVHDRPILDFGEPGTFDRFGVMAATVLRHQDEVWLYYVGWERCLGVPYNHSIGLAVSRDGGITFERFGKGPIITRELHEPFIQNSPFVMKLGDVFHMWYSTGTRWVAHAGAFESIYVVVHATSTDGIHWSRDGRPCIETIVEDEVQTNPCMITIEGRHHMWFCYRRGIDFRNADHGYRIGYAWSDDLLTWHRDDSKGELLPASGSEWDSQMVCYPCVVLVDDSLLMFYSGNYFGRDGFGYARLRR
ncbi:MAG: glycosylase [Candidatus Eremiobacteraeota bacterium]|uniref:Glycosyl hydrolase family 32 N-terminal domain-containing protein n=1 Tax=mine drainage metagenome TaxID=410659 RepID=E6PC98_9ZZZZ|nr:glycosylase [Candidatus Eremiobacteraeota bacterium]